jgi:hypothetical protein
VPNFGSPDLKKGGVHVGTPPRGGMVYLKTIIFLVALNSPELSL